MTTTGFSYLGTAESTRQASFSSLYRASITTNMIPLVMTVSRAIHFAYTPRPKPCEDNMKQVVVDDETARVVVIETPGQEEYAALRVQDIGDGEAFVLAYSITSRDSFEEMKDSWPMILVRNKNDLSGEREVSMEGMEAFDSGRLFVH